MDKLKSLYNKQIKAHVLRHVEFEGLGNIEKYFENNSIDYSETRLFKGDKLPEVEGIDLLVVMGGPMGIYDDEDFPFLAKERKFISNVIEHGIKVLGICLGAQFLSHSLGGEVYCGPYKEIGWFPVEYSQEFYNWLNSHNESIDHKLMSSYVFQWHGDTFTNPIGSISIARSEPGINQGFLYKDQILALQFHVEMTKDTVFSIVTNGRDEIGDLDVNHKYIQNENSIISEESFFIDNYKFLVQLLDSFLSN